MITYHSAAPSPAQAWTLFCLTGWQETYRVDAAAYAAAIQASRLAVHADEEGVLVGMARLLSDGIYATLVDVIVAPEYRRRGIASELVRRILRDASEMGVKQASLLSTRGYSALYAKLGFIARDPEAPGMTLALNS